MFRLSLHTRCSSFKRHKLLVRMHKDCRVTPIISLNEAVCVSIVRTPAVFSLPHDAVAVVRHRVVHLVANKLEALEGCVGKRKAKWLRRATSTAAPTCELSVWNLRRNHRTRNNSKGVTALLGTSRTTSLKIGTGMHRQNCGQAVV